MTYIGEVLTTNTKEFTAQALKVNESPAFGSFVKVEATNTIIFGIVNYITTGSIDSNRRPIAFGKREEILLEEQPQLWQLLKTDFSCIVIGHQQFENSQIGPYLGYFPDTPPKIHSFVEACREEEIRAITDDLRYLKYLVEFRGGNNDQLISACIRKGYSVWNESRDFLVKTGKFLLPLLDHDLDQFNAIFRSVR